MAGRGSGAPHPGASLGVGPTNSGGTPANKGLAAPAIADGFHTPLSSLPDWANTGADLFKKSSVMARSPEKKVECSGRQPGTPPAREKSSPKAADEVQEDMLKQLTGLGPKARELKKLMEGMRCITNPMRDIVDEIDYLQKEVLSAVQCIFEEQENVKEIAKKNLRRSSR